MAWAGMSECLKNSVRKIRTRSSVSGTARCEPTAAHASRASAQFKCLSSSLNQPTFKKDETIMVTRFFYAFEWVSRVTKVNWLAAGWKPPFRISVRILSQNVHKSWICFFDVMWTVASKPFDKVAANLSSPKHPHSLWGPPRLIFIGDREVKWPGRQDDPFSAEVKHKWSYTSALLICLSGLHKNSFPLPGCRIPSTDEHCPLFQTSRLNL